MWQGTPMTFGGAAKAMTLEGAEQTIARDVTAGVVSIKQLGTNGGGYFGPNSAYPFENPTPLLRRDLVDHHHPHVDGGDAGLDDQTAQARNRDLRDDARDLRADGRVWRGADLLIYGLGGVVLPFVGIKAIDIVLVAIGLA
jgi:hypothetical protein